MRETEKEEIEKKKYTQTYRIVKIVILPILIVYWEEKFLLTLFEQYSMPMYSLLRNYYEDKHKQHIIFLY